MTGQSIVAAVMAKRTEAGLVLRFVIPDRADIFVCYPKDDAQKIAWLANAARKGWKVAS
jgi:hypothetical protein